MDGWIGKNSSQPKNQSTSQPTFNRYASRRFLPECQLDRFFLKNFGKFGRKPAGWLPKFRLLCRDFSKYLRRQNLPPGSLTSHSLKNGKLQRSKQNGHALVQRNTFLATVRADFRYVGADCTARRILVFGCDRVQFRQFDRDEHPIGIHFFLVSVAVFRAADAVAVASRGRNGYPNFYHKLLENSELRLARCRTFRGETSSGATRGQPFFEISGVFRVEDFFPAGQPV